MREISRDKGHVMSQAGKDYCEQKLKKLVSQMGPGLNAKWEGKITNRHKGKRAFIGATGPSLNLIDLSKLDGEIVFGLNAFSMARTPTYHVAIDPAGYHVYFDDGVYVLPEALKSEILFMEWDNCWYDVKSFAPKCGVDVDALLSKVFFYVADLSSQNKDVDTLTTWERGYPFVVNGDTCLFAAIQFALVMGCNPIYLLGADGRTKGKSVHYRELSPSNKAHPDLARWFTANGETHVPYPDNRCVVQRTLMRVVANARALGVGIACATPHSVWPELRVMKEVKYNSLF